MPGFVHILRLVSRIELIRSWVREGREGGKERRERGVITTSVYSMNWLDGEHTCTYKDDSSLSTSAQLCGTYPPPRSPSTAGKLFFNYFPYASQWTRVSLLCSSNRCCHMPHRTEQRATWATLGKFHFIFELFMLQWKFLAGNASKGWQGVAGRDRGSRQCGQITKINVPLDKLSICHTQSAEQRTN